MCIDLVTMTVSLYCTNVDNRSVLVLIVLHSGFDSRINPLFFVPTLSFLSTTHACQNLIP